MHPRRFVLFVLAVPCFIYLIFFLAYLGNPSIFHFRAWELYDNVVYNGWGNRQQVLNESGDSSREFLFQRYIKKNNVSVNEMGNRVACYDAQENKSLSVLMLGDSQLFGSGLDDTDTFPVQLCRKYGANIYNGARRNGISLLRIKEYKFFNVVFTATERFGFKGYCSKLDEFKKMADEPKSMSSMEIRGSIGGVIKSAKKFVPSYLTQRLGVLLNLNQQILAPSAHIIKYRHVHTVDDERDELTCISALQEYFAGRNINVGFIYFPAHQTIYSDKAGFQVDEETLNFIPNMVTKMTALGLNTFDTKACLMNERDRAEVYQRHDTHLSSEGFRALANCMDGSKLRFLYAKAR